MDDYSINSLTESKNEWCARLVSILTHSINQGVRSIFDEAVKLCVENDENNKYLMTFQNLLSTIPQWNPNTIENEKKRIEQVSGCKYLEELITCVHIIQLKALTCIRVGQKQKKIDIDIPSLDKFIHQIYINTARKLYTNIYLFEKDLFPLQIQKNNRELELLIKEAILMTIRDNVPVEAILRAYMDETEEHEVIVKKEEPVASVASVASVATIDPALNANATVPVIATTLSVDNKLNIMAEKIKSETNDILAINKLALDGILKSQPAKTTDTISDRLSIDFSNIDNMIDGKGTHHDVSAPKDIETLEKIAAINNAKRAQEEANDNESSVLSIGDDVKLSMDIMDLNDNPLLGDIEEL